MATQRNYSPEEAVKRLDELSSEAHEFIYSDEWGEILNKIGEKNSLHLDQVGSLEYETAALVLGFTEPNDFPKILSESLVISSETANTVATDINELILLKIRKSMMSSQEKPGTISVERPPTDLGIISVPSGPIPSQLPSNVEVLLEKATQHVAQENSTPIIPKNIPPQNKIAVDSAPNKYKTDPYREPIE